MALIKCEECGREISERAAACPHCGCPTGSSTVHGLIHFYWVGQKTDSIRKTTVVVDDVEVSVMRCGDCVSVAVDEGVHKVDLFQGRHHLIDDYVEIDLDNEEEYYAYKERMGFAHPQLKRVDIDFPVQKAKSQNVPRCPTCGSESIKKISLSKKVFSFEMVGFASNSIGKTFECKNCHYKW